MSVIGVVDVTMKNQARGIHHIKVYVVMGERESMLGKEDALALGILKL